MMIDDQVLISNPGTGFPDFLLDDGYMNAMLCAEEAELMRALGDPLFDPSVGGGEFSGSDDTLDTKVNDKSVIIAAASAAGLTRNGGLKRAAFSMNDLTALQPNHNGNGNGSAKAKRDQGKVKGRRGSKKSNKLKSLDENQPLAMKQEELSSLGTLDQPDLMPNMHYGVHRPGAGPSGPYQDSQQQVMMPPQSMPQGTHHHPGQLGTSAGHPGQQTSPWSHQSGPPHGGFPPPPHGMYPNQGPNDPGHHNPGQAPGAPLGSPLGSPQMHPGHHVSGPFDQHQQQVVPGRDPSGMLSNNHPGGHSMYAHQHQQGGPPPATQGVKIPGANPVHHPGGFPGPPHMNGHLNGACPPGGLPGGLPGGPHGGSLRRVASSPNFGKLHLEHATKAKDQPGQPGGLMNGHAVVGQDQGPPGANGHPGDTRVRIGTLTLEERRARILRYRQKRHERNFRKRIKYNCRKTLADSRPRIRGRFARNDEIEELLKQKKLEEAKNSGSGSGESSGGSSSKSDEKQASDTDKEVKSNDMAAAS